MRYNKLTNYINVFSKNYSAGNWIVGGGSGGKDERPITIPFLKYDRKIFDFMYDMNEFMDRDYDETLNSCGIDVNMQGEEQIDVTEADDKEVLALITYVIKSERFCDGEIKSVVESGTMTRWLERLKEIDTLETT